MKEFSHFAAGKQATKPTPFTRFMRILKIACADDQPLLQKPFVMGILLRKLEVEEVLASWSRL